MDEARLVGDYVLGPRIGSGSFAVVWRASHRSSGSEVAVKEIDKKLLSPKVRDNLLKEISILSTIDHPNIIRFHEAIETSDRIYLVLEYCGGGDLAGYIYRHGKVSEHVARHFMRQLAAGLQVLQEKHLIHRDLKPQNLLLSTNEVTPLLKIGDFGFARSLTPQNLADTFCGSPLYMAPEIIQNQKYDAKADLWSAGAILYQLVTGKPPFDGNNHIQLFQNIVRGSDLQFPEDPLQEIHLDCIDLCRSLLRRNPIERLTFREFFNHKFLQMPRPSLLDVEQSQSYPTPRAELRGHSDLSTSGEKSLLHSQQPGSTSRIKKSVNEQKGETYKNDGGSSSSTSSRHLFIEGQCSSNQPPVVDSLELIEREYVLVNRPSVSMEASSECLDTSQQETGLLPSSSLAENPSSNMSGPQPTTRTYLVTEVQRSTMVHPPTRLKLLHQYAQTLTELAREMYNGGQVRESFAVDLVVLAIWTKALDICDSWMISAGEDLPPETSSRSEHRANQGPSTVPETSGLDFSSPSSAKTRVAEEFVIAYNQAENSSTQLKETSAASHMPDAMETIYEKALTYGKNGGVEEYMNNKASAATLYSKAIVLLSFVVEEAVTLPLSPPFSLTPDDKKRILFYISNLQNRRSHL
ncbi:PREDICTED: serine/threonine-protein kinase ATG1a [Tarenaya hassleriana]|uniref:serine/threonine-protein kinase ATG1a n=1 Tax=Tarenaya hassleriana TaxID=28532 RepID=UPI00053C8993|nr:PREDICTED: serine/threonine-protein kinase ATG1a [Tarenaya hassleriana]XP_010523843.1 PREDICTED: serine/threonine-protein kinase ATG1a [Tarenaya hassleriana]XP_010523844.1 PREDICTED: serine/threonine-protein kinase ATG1a [Tarenaya hassleriana]